MRTTRRRQAGEGGVSAYKNARGENRYLIKYQARGEDGTTKTVLRRRTRAGEPS